MERNNTNNQNRFQSAKKGNKPIHYVVTVIIIFVIGLLTTKFGDFANLENYVNKNDNNVQQQYEYNFADDSSWIEHFEKHGHEFGYTTKEEYLQGANDVINNPSSLHKYEAEDGDDCYYLQATNEFVVVSLEGEIRTYFKPDDGVAYFNRQMKTVILLNIA